MSASNFALAFVIFSTYYKADKLLVVLILVKKYGFALHDQYIPLFLDGIPYIFHYTTKNNSFLRNTKAMSNKRDI